MIEIQKKFRWDSEDWKKWLKHWKKIQQKFRGVSERNSITLKNLWKFFNHFSDFLWNSLNLLWICFEFFRFFWVFQISTETPLNHLWIFNQFSNPSENPLNRLWILFEFSLHFQSIFNDRWNLFEFSLNFLWISVFFQFCLNFDWIFSDFQSIFRKF